MSEGISATGNGLLMTTQQFAHRLNLQRYQVSHLIETGKIPDAQLWIGGRRLFTETELLAAADYLKQHQRKGVKEAT